MDLSSYADLAVKLVNHEDLSNLDGLRALLGETGRGLQAARTSTDERMLSRRAARRPLPEARPSAGIWYRASR